MPGSRPPAVAEVRPIVAQHDAPFPIARMMFQMIFLVTLGTLYGFSTWSYTFIGSKDKPGPFPSWTQTELGFVYSMGIFGGFATPLGGFLYDRLGASPTYVVGASLVLAGWAMITLIAFSGSVPAHSTHLAVGLCYAIEELGSGTLYMGVALDTLLNFPAKKVSVSMGLVALGYSLSSVGTALVVRLMQPNLWVIVSFITTVVPALAFIRVFILGAPAASATPAEPGSKAEADAVGGGATYGQAMSTPAFRILAANGILCLAPCCALLGFMKVAGDAVGTNGSNLATTALVANCVGRIAVGASYDLFRDALPSSHALFALEVAMAVNFGALWYGSLQVQAAGTLTCGCLLVTLAFGGTAPVIGAYIKDSFDPSTSGFIMGVSQLCVAFANFAFNSAFGPTDVSRVAGFSTPFATSTMMCLLCAATHFLALGPRIQAGKVA